MHIKLIIFDFDDTILHLDVRWDALKKNVINFTENEGFVIDKTQHLITLGNLISNTPSRKKTIDEIYLQYETECVIKKSYTPFQNMIEFIKTLKAKGYKLAIASGNHSLTIKKILNDLDLDIFDLTCGRDMVDRCKPYPDQLVYVLENLNYDKQSVLFIGDSSSDELAAKAAGITCFRIRPNSEADLEKLRKMLV